VITPLAFTDDDPTGPQSCADVSVTLTWSLRLLRASLSHGPTFLLTNSRALSPAAARRRVTSAATAAWKAGAAQVVMRGDSTLRGHVFEEFMGWVDASGHRPPPLVLVPTLPAAGRVTLGGVHYLRREGQLMPLSETEYARDPRFSYSTSRLIDWAAERSDGYFKSSCSREVGLEDLRETSGTALEDALSDLARSSCPGVCVPDAETVEDLQLISNALSRVSARGVRFAVRCAPAFAAVHAHSYTTTPAALPSARGNVLVVCGSYVANTTHQMEALLAAFPNSVEEADVVALLSAKSEAVIKSMSRRVARLLNRSPVAVLMTSRSFAGKARSAASSLLVASRIAAIVRGLPRPPRLVIGKGGVTSAVLARQGLGATNGRVVGPVAPGISLWELQSEGGAMPYIVFPGNVGEAGSLVELVRALLAGGSDASSIG
jgi:uncharacterized protein YgbK (DUF1537 family)